MNLDDILDLGTWRLALSRWHVLVLTLATSFLLAVATYALLPQKYHVTATVIGTRYQNDITPSNQSAAFSAAALLGGTANDLPAITDFRLYMQLLISPELGASLIDDPIAHRIFRKSWNKDHWAPPDTLMQYAANIFFPLIGQRPWSAPDGFTMARYLENHVSIAAAKDAKIIIISTWDIDREFGKELLAVVSSRADSFVKHMAQKRFQAKVAFLQNALSTANVQETRTALGTALAKAETDEIYSFSDLPFAAEFVAPPDSPWEPQFPKLINVVAIFMGLSIFMFFIYILLLKKRKMTIYKSASTRSNIEIRTGVQNSSAS
jgi:hypothetical protein